MQMREEEEEEEEEEVAKWLHFPPNPINLISEWFF
jgi:hypothetical protein